MKIRAVTSFFDPASAIPSTLNNLASCSNKVADSLHAKGYTVQSQRIATTPFPLWLAQAGKNERQQRITSLAAETKRLGWQYTSLGPALPGCLEDYQEIPSILKLDNTLFAGGVISADACLYPPAALASARVIVENAASSPDGFTNLRFAALANVRPYAPFFPAAYARPGEKPAIALAIECADEAVRAFTNAISLDAGLEAFLAALESNARAIQETCAAACSNNDVDFKGLDFSPAPYPQEWCSLGKAMELLGVPALGNPGSLAIAAVLASALDKGNWQRTGFNGLMLAVLEDSTLAHRAAESRLTLKDLLLYSAVCGTGLDTIPLPGDATPSQVSSVLMDLGALAIRLNKPLTGRLMPIPRKKAGDATCFEFEYFANSRVMALEGDALGAPFVTAPEIDITPRKSKRD